MTEANEDVVAEAKDAKTEPQAFEPMAKTHPSRILAERTATPFSMQRMLLQRFLEQSFEVNTGVKVTMRTISSGVMEILMRKLQQERGNDWLPVYEESYRQHAVALAVHSMTSDGAPLGPDIDAAILEGADEKKILELINTRVRNIKPLPASFVGLLYVHYLLFQKRADDFISGNQDEMGKS